MPSATSLTAFPDDVLLLIFRHLASIEDHANSHALRHAIPLAITCKHFLQLFGRLLCKIDHHHCERPQNCCSSTFMALLVRIASQNLRELIMPNVDPSPVFAVLEEKKIHVNTLIFHDRSVLANPFESVPMSLLRDVSVDAPTLSTLRHLRLSKRVFDRLSFTNVSWDCLSGLQAMKQLMFKILAHSAANIVSFSLSFRRHEQQALSEFAKHFSQHINEYPRLKYLSIESQHYIQFARNREPPQLRSPFLHGIQSAARTIRPFLLSDQSNSKQTSIKALRIGCHVEHIPTMLNLFLPICMNTTSTIDLVYPGSRILFSNNRFKVVAFRISPLLDISPRFFERNFAVQVLDLGNRKLLTGFDVSSHPQTSAFISSITRTHTKTILARGALRSIHDLRPFSRYINLVISLSPHVETLELSREIIAFHDSPGIPQLLQSIAKSQIKRLVLSLPEHYCDVDQAVDVHCSKWISWNVLKGLRCFLSCLSDCKSLRIVSLESTERLGSVTNMDELLSLLKVGMNCVKQFEASEHVDMTSVSGQLELWFEQIEQERRLRSSDCRIVKRRRLLV